MEDQPAQTQSVKQRINVWIGKFIPTFKKYWILSIILLADIIVLFIVVIPKVANNAGLFSSFLPVNTTASLKTSINTSQVSSTPTSTTTTSQTPTPTYQVTNQRLATIDVSESALDSHVSVSGTLTEITPKLELYTDGTNNTNDFEIYTTYYSAGTIQSGKYLGYKLIVSVTEGFVSDGLVDYFVTKDNTHYTLVGTQTVLDNTMYNTEKVVTADNSMDISLFPQRIVLNADMLLVQGEIPTSTTDANMKDSNGNEISTNTLVTQLDPAKYQKLNTTIDGYTAYELIETEGTAPTTYVGPRVEIFLQDKSGLIMQYSEETSTQFSRYISDVAAYNAKVETYNAGLSAHLHDSSYTTPEPYSYPSFNIEKNEITTTASSTSLYKSYAVALDRVCAVDLTPYSLENVSQSDLKQIGTYGNLPLYTFVDSNHPIIQAVYQKHVSDESDDDFKQLFGVSKPSYAAYVAQNPVLVLKDDYLGRYFFLGENDYPVPGGCGKPVMYFYPQSPTQVHVNFLAPVNFQHDIPTYHNGWDILAMPNGQLHDLRPSLTACDTMPTNVFGLEYAKVACEQNTYPYIYWSGNIQSVHYPTVTEGWIVSKDHVASFLDAALTLTGLTDREKTDMTEYWVHQLLSKNKPFYRISLLQTQMLNKMFPINISPRPDSVNRIFLDWQPLDSATQVTLKPEHLEPFVRNGFTMVEWGGLQLP